MYLGLRIIGIVVLYDFRGIKKEEIVGIVKYITFFLIGEFLVYFKCIFVEKIS